ncbi:MAG: hypothetical protein IJC24_00030 [Clostridia bacterium]|nr:hypothetical protein [Clostridia bacterium]MBR4019079.1 hypothetical protein [Clostridia bacterium]
MKRVKAACICQTLHFLCKDENVTPSSLEQIRAEVANYKKTLDKTHTQYKILEESVQSDNSIIIKIIKQYNQSPIGEYLN